MTFSLVVPDLHLDVAGLDTWKNADLALPALGRLLAGSTGHRVESGWRTGLLHDVGWEEAASVAPAAIAAWALQPAFSGPAAGFAQPVHQVAGMSSVHLHPAGLLQLDDAEAQQLCVTFNRELGDSVRLCRVGGGLLIVGELGAAKDGGETQEPGRYLGRELVPAGERLSPALRRLGAETEMWLQQHPVNRAREIRGELPVIALWFWGAGPAASRDIPRRDGAAPAVGYGDDPFLVGLWTALRGELRPAVAHRSQVRETSACVILGVALQRGSGAMLGQLEDAWFEPLLVDIESRRIPALRLRIGQNCWEIRRQGLSRWWRRPKPWWEHLA